LYQISLLDEPTEGEVIVDDVDVLALSNKERTQFRLERLGYVFQDYALVPELTARENIMMPLLMLGWTTEKAESTADEVLSSVGLGHRLDNLPSQLSGGEQQRVSIARAVAQDPTILFADEPTANLDNTSSEAVIEVMDRLHQEGQTIVMVTHEKEYTTKCDRIVYLDDGKIVDEEVL
jgi:putative ABC transport system ATP-binding protein